MSNVFLWIAKFFRRGTEEKPVPNPEDILPPFDGKPEAYPVYELPWQVAIERLEAFGIQAIEKPGNLPDKKFFFTDETHWRGLLPQLTFKADPFPQIERRDCDEFSKLASAKSGFEFGLNCLQVYGDSPVGYHAFNLVLCNPRTWRVFEPNGIYPAAGSLMPLGENGYKPRKWKS